MQVTQSSPLPSTEPSPQTPAPIGHVALRGMIWQVGNAIGAKFVTVIQQLIIAKYFLNDKDFGLLAVSQVVISIASLGQCLGVAENLVRRHRKFDRWVDAAFWLNLGAGLLGMLLVLALIPFWKTLFLAGAQLFGGRVNEAPAIEGVLAVWALWLPLDAMVVVFQARLRANMQFRAVATLGFIQVTGIAVLGLFFAWLGLGVYSVVIPIPVMWGVVLIGSWVLSKQRIRARLDWRRSRMILGDSPYFMAAAVLVTLSGQGDYIVTSMFFAPGIVGAYYYAYRMSTQTVQLVGGQVQAVMLSSFSRIEGDLERQAIAYERTCATLLLVGMPLSFLQAVVAEPVFHLVFADKWDAALPLFCLLSIGLAFMMPMPSATGLMLARGRYRQYLRWQAIVAVTFLSFVLAGALTGNVHNVAIAVCINFIIMGPVVTLVPTHQGGAVAFLGQIFGFPLLAGGAASGVAWGISRLLPADALVLQIVLRTAGFLGTFGVALLLCRPQAAVDLVARVKGMVKRSSTVSA
jgi:O-antigen/teichoic acid export membrane protein